MKRPPKDLTGTELVKLLASFGYVATRQNGSHIRIETPLNGGHKETIPRHSPIKVGTLNGILKNIANHFGLSKQELVDKLF